MNDDDQADPQVGTREMEETEQRLAAARAKRATAQALIDAQKQLVDQADAEERALKEQLDAERTDKYEGKFVRGQSINGTVRAVKYGEAYISWADGVDYAIKFEHLDMCLERYEAWAAGVLQDWDCAPSGACLDGPEAPPPLVEAEPAADAAPALPSPRSVVATPAVAQLVAAAAVLPLIKEAEAAPKPLVSEPIVAATVDDDDVPVVKDVAAAMGGHKAAPDCQEQPVVKPGCADADVHGDDVQGIDVEMEGADAEEGCGEEKEEDPLNADGVEAATSGAEGGVVVEEEGCGAKGVEATRGGADGEEDDPEAMEEEDNDDTISYVETGVKASVVEARVVDDVEARDVDEVVVGATGDAGVVEGDGDAVANAASASAIVRFTAGPLHVSTSAPDEVLAVDDYVVAHYGHGLVEGKTVVRKAKEPWSKGVVKAVHRVSSRRVTYDILYDDCGTCETGVLASNVRRRSADRCPGHVRPLNRNTSAGLDLVEPVPTNAPGHLVESSATFEVPTAPPPPLITAPTEELTDICTICHHEVSVDCDVVLKCGHVFHMSCLGEYSKHCGHAPTRRSFQVPCANCRVVDRVELGTNPRCPQRYNPQEEAERPQLATRRRPAVAEPAPRPRARRRPLVMQPRTAVVVDENYKPTQVVEPRWHPSGCDLCSRPLVLSAGRAVVIGWLPAAESCFLVDGERAALYKAAFTTGHRVGATVYLGEDEVREYLAPEAFPSADDCVALMTVGSGGGDNRVRWATEFGGEGAGAGENAFANHVLLQPEAVSPPTLDARVGRLIEVYWAGDKVWYKGRVIGQKIVNGAVQLSVKYDDGDEHDEALQDEPFAGDGVPPDDRKPWYWRFAKQPNEAALPDKSADVLPPPEFQLCLELSEVCESVETSSSVEAMEIEAMETHSRAATPKRSLTVTFRLDNAKKQKTDVDAEAEFEFPENQNNAKVLSLLKELQEIEVAASQRCL